MTIYRTCEPEIIRLGTRQVGFRCSCGHYGPVDFMLSNRQRPSAIKKMIKTHVAEYGVVQLSNEVSNA